MRSTLSCTTARPRFGGPTPCTEFDLTNTALTGPHVDTTSKSTNAFSSDRQRLGAVEQLSLVASRILDPTELTRVALDEIIKLLAADRAYLFVGPGR